MFSTSMIASSTTSPIAMARPPSVSVFSVMPIRCNTPTATSSDSGIAVSELNAVRRLNRKANSTTATSAAPSSSEWSMLRIEASMKFAGRKMRSCNTTPSAAIAGFISASAFSSPSVTSSVLAPYWLETISTTPGSPSIAASPTFGSGPSWTRATSFIRTVTPLWCASITSPSSAAVSDCPSAWSTMRCVSFSTKPAPRNPVEARAAARTSPIESWNAASLSATTRICNCRTSPPNTTALDTPGTPSSRGRSVQSANVRRSICERLSEVSPTASTRLAADVRGAITGVFTSWGISPDSSPSRSLTICRARNTSLCSSKTAVITESPCTDCERMDSRLATPLMAFSTGRVTSASTSSGESPGASVWITTCGGAKSG